MDYRCVQRICREKVESGRRKGVHTSTPDVSSVASASSLPQVTDKYLLRRVAWVGNYHSYATSPGRDCKY